MLLAVLLLVASPAPVRAEIARSTGATAGRPGAHRTGPVAMPRLWAVQVSWGARGWFDRSMLKMVQKDGINAVAVRVAALGPRRIAVKRFESARRFAASQHLYLVAVLPAKADSPVTRRAFADCAHQHSVRLRCAVEARSVRAAARLARRHGSRRFVAVYVKTPNRLSNLARLSLRRRVVVISPLYRAFDTSLWSAAIVQAAATPSVDMAVAPQTAQSTPAVQQFAALLSAKHHGHSAGVPDTQPPSTPTGLTANAVTQSSMTLSWNASTDNVGVVGYRVFSEGTEVGTPSSPSFSLTGLACGTSYALVVVAFDAAGNVSGTASLDQATAACPDTQAPSVPSGLAPSAASSSSIALSWTASSDNVGVAGYDVFLNGTLVGSSTATSYAFSGLSCATSYTLGVAAFDAAGNVSGTASASGSTSACPDTQPPSTPTALATSGVGQSSISLSWTASTDNVGVAGYRLFLGGVQVGTVTSGTSYAFSALSCGTSYSLGVAAYDAAGNVSGTASVSRSTASCTDTQPPSTPAGLTASAVTQTSMTLSWNASTDNVGVAGYDVFLNGLQVGTSASTSYAFSGLSCGASYTLGVAAFDAAGNASATATVSHSTSACPDTQPPSTPSGLATSGVGQTSMTLSWTASTDNVGVAGYRLFLGGVQVGTVTSGTSYAFSALSCGTSYSLGVAAYDSAGNVSGTASVSHSTASCADTQPPSTPTGLATSSVTQNSMTLSWTASTDNVGVAGYDVFLGVTQVGTASSTSFAFTGLACGTSYTLGVVAFDAAGNDSGEATLTRSTSACPDTQPPSTPSGLTASAVGQTSMTLSWTASTDNVGVVGYRLFQGGLQVGTVSSGTSFVFSGLSCGTSYSLGVAAYDAAGNVSGTASASYSTSACPDTQPPSTPTGLVTSSVAQTSVGLSWTASTDNVGVTGYRLFLNGTQVGTSASTSYSFTGLGCATSYSLGVAAYDAAGNVSGTATVVQATSACPPPASPTNLAVSSAGQTAMTLTWASSGVGVTGYRLFLNGTQVGTTASTSYSFSGLVCGTSYTLGVAAYDAAGDVSATSTLVSSTSACAAPGVANLWVKSGAAGSCTRSVTAGAFSASTACGSFQAAYSAAQCGDVVGVQPGSYASQTISSGAKTCSSTTQVLFTSVPGGTCTDNTQVTMPSFSIGVTYVELQCMDANPSGTTTCADVSGSSHTSVIWNTLDQMAMHCGWFDSDHLRVTNSTFGPDNTCQTGMEDLIDFRANTTNINDVTFDHDTFETVTAPPDFECGVGKHVDSMQGYGMSNLVISNSVFYGCPGQCIIFRPYNGGTPGPITIVNSIFNEPQSPGQAIDIGSDLSSDGDHCNGPILIENNDFVNQAAVHGGCWNAPSVIFRNNIMDTGSCGFGGGASYSYNVFYGGGTCGTHAKSCTPTYVGATTSVTSPGDYDLASTDICAKGAADQTVGNYPTTDMHGNPRPLGSAVDAGADEIP